MKQICIALIGCLLFFTSSAQKTIHWDGLGKTLYTTDSILVQINQAKVGDTVVVAYTVHPLERKPIQAVIQSHKAVNHAVTNISISLLDIKNTRFFFSVRKGLEKGKGFIGRITHLQSDELYQLNYTPLMGYYFERIKKSTLITP